MNTLSIASGNEEKDAATEEKKKPKKKRRAYKGGTYCLGPRGGSYSGNSKIVSCAMQRCMIERAN